MKVTDEMLKEKGDDLFYAIINGEELIKTIKTKRGNFSVKYPNQRDLQSIDWLMARWRGGLPATSFDDNATIALLKTATLNVCVTETPAWFSKAKEKNELFDWRDVPDTELIDELYVKAWSFRQEVKNALGRTKEDSNRRANDGEAVQEIVDDGIFSGCQSAADGK